MAFAHQVKLGADLTNGKRVELIPITAELASRRTAAAGILKVVQEYEDLLELQLPGLKESHSSVRKIQRRHRRIANSALKEGYVVTEDGRFTGQATLLNSDGVSAQIDFWIPRAQFRPETGLVVGRLLIGRGFEVCDGVAPHAWLYDDDQLEPSVELKQLMEPSGEPTTDYMTGDQDKNAPSDVEARLYVARLSGHA